MNAGRTLLLSMKTDSLTGSIVKAAERPPHSKRLAGLTMALFLSASVIPPARCWRYPAAQVRTLQPEDGVDAGFSRELAELGMDAERRTELQNALNQRDYKRAESLLVEEAEREPKSVHAAKALTLAGGIFFLDGEYPNSVIAWKKAEAIAPLDDRSRFTLAMAYIKLNRRDWSRPELEKLVAGQPQNALYLYWLARLDYDAMQHWAAIARLQKVVEIDPKMARAYDTLGLCYDYVGKPEEAIKSYNRAIELNRLEPKPSPWPHVDLAVTLISLNRLAEAENNLREALRYDAQLPQAHFQLGRVLEMRGELEAAVPEFNQAATLNPDYPEPHLSLGRIYNRLHQTSKAKAEIATFQQLKQASESGSLGKQGSPPKSE
jgi:tetratricopeptide (TPR) repeat protein